MILTDYYRFEKLPNQKSKLRIDCTASTSSYDPLEALRNKRGDLFLYIGDNTHTKAGKERKADLVLSRTIHISSVYNPDLNLPYWYGDMKGTTDAFLFVHKNTEFINGEIQAGAVIELFVARGQRNNRNQLYNILADDGFDDEMNHLRKQVTKTVTEL
ncbi:hypothetical protein [Mediterranea massiliensis]|uniref:hypothetical protein n=1 Tax=Mediterranea massiliensis TaxID=1841865 RepID=UPI000933047A|nr:hypothetical protein [Mediterranea massiliensis]